MEWRKKAKWEIKTATFKSINLEKERKISSKLKQHMQSGISITRVVEWSINTWITLNTIESYKAKYYHMETYLIDSRLLEISPTLIYVYSQQCLAGIDYQTWISIWIFQSANYLLGFLQTCTQIIQSHAAVKASVPAVQSSSSSVAKE